MEAWLVYGPFDLSDANAAKVAFTFWLSSEEHHDLFMWMASLDGNRFHGQGASGASEGWADWEFDLSEVNTLGDLRGEPRVWFGLAFRSDASTNDWGVFVDDVEVLEHVGGGQPPAIPRPESLPGNVLLTSVTADVP
jgi:hypothetical protein